MITTGKTIFDLLEAHAPLVALVGTNMFPLIAPEGTASPFLLYQRSFEVIRTKDGPANSSSAIIINIISEKYLETIDISTAVHNALKGEANLLSGTEVYEEGAFIQTLTFQFWSAP